MEGSSVMLYLPDCDESSSTFQNIPVLALLSDICVCINNAEGLDRAVGI